MTYMSYMTQYVIRLKIRNYYDNIIIHESSNENNII